MVQRSLASVRREAIPLSIMLGVTDPFMIPYALALGATPLQAGLLSSVRNAVLSVAQLGSARAAHVFRSRKVLVLRCAALQALCWVPLAFVVPLFGSWAIPALIVLYTLGTTSGAFGAPAWGGLVTEYLAPHERGRFFGRRALVMGLLTTGAGLLAGGLLHAMRDTALAGFGLLCLAAAVSRAWSCRELSQLAEGPWHEPPDAHVPFRQFLLSVRTNNFARFACGMAALSFAVNLASPYLAVYMLQTLHYGYGTYAVVALVGTLVGILVTPRWGRIGDAHGNHLVLRWTTLAVGIIPWLWVVSPHPVWLGLAYLLGGLLWSGLNLSAVNFVYDAISPSRRLRYLAYFNVMNGCGVSLGALVGGWLVGRLPAWQGSPFLTLFALSGAMRLLAALLFRAFVREVREVRQVGLREVVYDLLGERVFQVFGFFSVRPEEELGRRR